MICTRSDPIIVDHYCTDFRCTGFMSELAFHKPDWLAWD